ncbi:MAG TPA: glycoside hydrolase family 36 protein [Myxococcota bacterium]|nr:glycoside hydrolase family 36 protein [Myxococcota bacterium]
MLVLLLGCSSEAPALCSDPLRLEGDVLVAEGHCGYVELRAEVHGEGELEVSFTEVEGGLQPEISGEGVFEALVLSGQMELSGDEDLVVWKQGYQSWWWSGVTELQPLEWEDGLPVAGGDGDGMSATEETSATSWWVGLAGRPDGGCFLIGALSATRTKAYAAFGDDLAAFVWGGRGERITVTPSTPLTLDPVHGGFAAGLADGFGDYALAARVHNGVQVREDPPVGWATWYQFYSEITEEQVRENLAVASQIEALEIFQIDDGWQVQWGQWEAGEDFPSGMAQLAEDIRAEGLTPGLWMAPFYVEREYLYDEHPDWFVHDAEGEPLSFSNFGDHDYLIVDVTHPDAADWLAEQISVRVDEGWTYLKLDFLYAGAQEGVRQEDVTGMEAYIRGMQILREAAGEQTWILACGAPMLPSLGYADSYRTGADIAFEFDPDPRREYLRWAARATAARSWQNGVWWWIDPDQLILRDPFSDTEATGAVVAQVLSGGPWILGDDLPSLAEDRLELALDPDLLALIGVTARPRDPLRYTSGPDFGPLAEFADPNDVVPPVWSLEDGSTALINLGDSSITVQGPGGTELLSGAVAEAGARTLAPGAGEIWR